MKLSPVQTELLHFIQNSSTEIDLISVSFTYQENSEFFPISTGGISCLFKVTEKQTLRSLVRA